MIASDIGVVTSCTGYGRYLGEWSESLLRLTRRPAFVGIFTHGEGADLNAGMMAAETLIAAGFHVKHIHRGARLDLGAARNHAVAMAPTEWVMHLDADDVLYPQALEAFEALAPEADVVQFGYERFGDLAAGPRFKRKTYRPHAGEESLANPTPASGCSPFRRWFWEHSPYRTDLTGGWDTALWLGFAHLGARFVPTPEPVFGYRQHAGSVFNTRRRTGWAAFRAGSRLQSLRVGESGVAVVVPHTPDGGERDRAWAWCRARYEALFPHWDIRTAAGPGGAWRKGAAIEAALRGCSAEVVVIADSDCVVPAPALHEAVAAVRSGRTPWVVPHTAVHRLTAAATEGWLLSEPCGAVVAPDAPEALDRPVYTGYAGGGVLVVGRSDYLATGGIPAAFAGWGAEDEALAVILDTLLGPHLRLPTPLVHLWHPPQRDKSQASKAIVRENRQRFNRLQHFAGDVESLFAVLQGGASRTSLTYFDAKVRHRTAGARGQVIRDEVLSVRDRFAEHRLAAQARRIRMPAAFDLKRQQRQEARRVREGKQLPAPANKMQPVPETKSIYASPQAEAFAQNARLSVRQLARIKPGPKGITLQAVRDFIATADEDEE